jgi:hypothetical protein
MSCTTNSATVTPSMAEERLSKADMFKIFLAIDRKLIQEAQAFDRKIFGLGAPELIRVDSLITDIMQADITDADIDELASGQLSGLGFLKKVVAAVKNTAEKIGNTKVAQTVQKVVEKAAQAAKTVTLAPLRLLVTTALRALKGPVAKAFIYTFIPADSPALQNPEVKRKREIQIKGLERFRSLFGYQEDYLKKHVRNAIVDHYKKTPEAIIHDFANKKETEFNGNIDFGVDEGVSGEPQLGIDPATIAAVASIVATVGGIAIAFKKPNVPNTNDWPGGVAPTANGELVYNPNGGIPDQANITNDPFYKAGESSEKSFWGSPAGIATIVGGVAVVGGGAYYALS